MPCCSYAAFLWGLEDQLNVLLFVPCSSGPRDASTPCEMPIGLSQVNHAALHRLATLWFTNGQGRLSGEDLG